MTENISAASYSVLSHLISVESPHSPEMKIKSYYFPILQLKILSSEMT